jgi:hypothetical protein
LVSNELSHYSQNLHQIFEIMDTDSSNDEIDSNVSSNIIDFEMDVFDDDINDLFEGMNSEVESDPSSTTIELNGNSESDSDELDSEIESDASSTTSVTSDSDESNNEVDSRTSSEADNCSLRSIITIPKPVKRTRSSIEDIDPQGPQPCCVCLERLSDVLITGCNHVVVCYECSIHPQFGRRCPLCRQKIKKTIILFY